VEGDPHRRLFEERPEDLLVLRELTLGPLPFRDVTDEAHELVGLAQRDRGRYCDLDGEDLPVLAQSFEYLPAAADQLARAVRMEALESLLVATAECGWDDRI